MPFVPIPNAAQLEFIYSWDLQSVENVLTYRIPTTPTVADLQVLCTAAIAWWSANLKPLQSNQAALFSVKATDLSTQTGPVVEDTTGLPIVGTGGTASVPNNVSCAVKLITNNRGRSFRGRIYHIGLPSSVVTGNTVSTTTRTALRNAWLAALTLGTSPIWTLCVGSRYTANAPRITGLATPVTDISVNNVVDSQRRRLPERGR
jgi:hypothetical protein